MYKNSLKLRKIADLQALTPGRVKKITLYLQVRGAGDDGGVLRGGVRHVGPVHCRGHHTGH